MAGFDPALPLMLARGMGVAGTISVAGTASFRAGPLCAAAPQMARTDAIALGHALAGLVRRSLVLALAGLAASLWLHACALAEPGGSPLPVLWPLLRHTLFGWVVAAQSVLLAVCWPLAGEPPGWLLPPAVVALAATVVDGHMVAEAGLVGPGGLVAVAHVLAAGCWLGSLLPLLVLLRIAPDAAGAAVRGYFRYGVLCVGVLVGSGLAQAAWLLGPPMGRWRGLYFHVLLGKFGGLLVLLALAARHHFGLAPALDGGAAALARGRLARSLGVECAIGGVVILLALWLSSLAPPGSMP